VTRISTNVLSLTAQVNLQRNYGKLDQAMTRLSTGLRINSGKDDPAGMIASDTLGREIASTTAAISNNQRASSIVGTVDSALSQVSDLLNQIRGLVTEAANSGTMGKEMLAANQIQVDSAIGAITRIAQSTKFQGLPLLDGTLDFIVDPKTNYDNDVVACHINEASLGMVGQLDVEVEVNTAATQGAIGSDIALYNPATTDLMLTKNMALGATSTDPTKSLRISALPDNVNYRDVEVEIVGQALGLAGPESAATWSEADRKVTIAYNTDLVGGASAAAVTAELDTLELGAGGPLFNTLFDYTVEGAVDQAVAATPLSSDVLTITAKPGQEGPNLNDVELRFEWSADAGAISAAYDDENKELVVTIPESQTEVLVQDVVDAINVPGIAEFEASVVSGASSDQKIVQSRDGALTANTEQSGGGIITEDIQFTLQGPEGTDVFKFTADTEVETIVNAINLVSGTTGVAAQIGDGTTNPIGLLVMHTIDYGSSAAVSIEVLEDGLGDEFKNSLSARRAVGTDIEAEVNGVNAAGFGNSLSVMAGEFNIEMTIAARTTSTIHYSITGGGALFQLGANVDETQQVRIGISDLQASNLRCDEGALTDLLTGEIASLADDPEQAYRIITEITTQVSMLRGRLGGFEQNSLQTNLGALSDSYENLVAGRGMIRDADFAQESAEMVRAQILIESGIQVLTTTNQNPQMILRMFQ